MKKSSVTSRSDYQQNFTEGSENMDTLKKDFEKAKICPDKFNNWVSIDIQRWLAFNLLPEIIDINMVSQ